MKYFIISLLCMTLFSCGQEPPVYSETVTPVAAPSNCSVTQTASGAEIDCPDGSSAIVSNGSNGLDGSSVTLVRLCPGFTPKYPDVFPEFAICDSNILYGVYWDGHNSWLTEIPPGNYASTSTDASCTFTVVSGCQVTKD